MGIVFKQINETQMITRQNYPHSGNIYQPLAQTNTTEIFRCDKKLRLTGVKGLAKKSHKRNFENLKSSEIYVIFAVRIALVVE